LSKKIDNTNRTVMNLETHLDHLTRQDEYLNRRLSQCERDTTHINNVLNQLPTFDQIESLIPRTLAAQAGNILPRMNYNEITTSCEPSTIHPDLPMSGNHDSDRRSMAPPVPTHNENHNYHDPSNTCIHDMDHAHANTFTLIFVPKATSLPEVIVKPDGQNNKNVGHSNVGYTKPFTYDGKTDWADYNVHFETVSKLNQWSDEVKVLKLVSSMQGAALTTVGHINTDSPPTYSELIQTLTKRFSPPNQSEMYMAQVDARIRKRGESLPELAQDVKRLIRLAHPSATAEIHDKLSYRAFRSALNDHDLEWAIVQSTIESIDETLHLALKYEAYNMSKRKPSLRYQSLNDTGQANNKSFKEESRSCFYCQKVGHLAKDCNKRKRDLQNTIDQSRTRTNTDFKPRDDYPSTNNGLMSGNQNLGNF
jgi:hypothetical protein